MVLGILMMLFIGMSVISILAITMMYLLKNEKAKKGMFYFTAVWGMAIAVLSYTALPQNFGGEQVAVWIIGFLSVAGIIVHIKSKTKAQYLTAYTLAALSVVIGMIKLFIF